MKDDDGDEEDGMDETLVPLDYQRNGQIRDDEVFTRMVAPLPEGCQLTVVIDACHSGSVLDLPYTFAATDSAIGAVESGDAPSILAPNGSFNMAALVKLGAELMALKASGNLTSAAVGSALARAIGGGDAGRALESFCKLF